MTASTPRVSVLIPVRDAAPTLGSCLRSVQRQTEANWECVVVDDGSSDASADIVADFARSDPRIRSLRGPREGITPALNRGLDACRAPLVARLDADDWMHRARLRLQCDTLDGAPGWAGVGCHVRLFPRRALGPGMRAYEEWLSAICTPEDVRRESTVECPLPHPSLLLRTGLLRDFGYRDRGWPEDYDLVLRLLAAGHTLGIVPRRLLGWRHGPERLSQTDVRYTAARFTACKARFLADGFLARGQTYLLWGYGGTGRDLARALAECGRRPERIVDIHPRRLGQRIADAPVVAPARLGPPGRLPLIVSVAGAEARARIRAFLARAGWREGADFVCAA
ncbi:MAG: glycosyltransferase family 2 protein [Myxococcota bacterium]